MDLNALRKMARKQREAEEAEDNTGHRKPQSSALFLLKNQLLTLQFMFLLKMMLWIRCRCLMTATPFPPQLPKMNRKKKWQRNVTVKRSTK